MIRVHFLLVVFFDVPNQRTRHESARMSRQILNTSRVGTHTHTKEARHTVPAASHGTPFSHSSLLFKEKQKRECAVIMPGLVANQSNPRPLLYPSCCLPPPVPTYAPERTPAINMACSLNPYQQARCAWSRLCWPAAWANYWH